MDVTHVTEPPPNALPMSPRRLGQLARGVGLLRGTLRSLSDLDGRAEGDDPAVLEVARNVLRLAVDLVAAALGAECAAERSTLRLDAAALAAGPTSGALRLGASALLGYLSGVVPVVDGARGRSRGRTTLRPTWSRLLSHPSAARYHSCRGVCAHGILTGTHIHAGRAPKWRDR